MTFSGQAYWHFLNAFGRDSYDGLGHEMTTVNNDPRIDCPNANWNGNTTNYCNGVTSDDVVAHEWGHAYTEYTAGLIYQWQPGALNESYSDIWGETVDLINGAGTDTPGGSRTSAGCSSFAHNWPPVIINQPAPGTCPAAPAEFGPALTTTGMTGDVVLSNDGKGSPTDACTAPNNAQAITGNVALVDRGTCAFAVKVRTSRTPVPSAWWSRTTWSAAGGHARRRSDDHDPVGHDRVARRQPSRGPRAGTVNVTMKGRGRQPGLVPLADG